MVYVAMFFLAAYIVCRSLQSLFLHPVMKHQLMSLNHLFVLIIVYITVILGFGLMYTSLLLMDIHVLVKNNAVIGHRHFFYVIDDAMYFSSMTMLSVGYGDLTPMGLGRWLSIVEALIGYLLPAAFVLNSVIERDVTSKKL